MNGIMRLIGIVLFITGMVFVGQGTGYFPYPATSFMVNQIEWAFHGTALMVGGLVLHWIFRARPDRP